MATCAECRFNWGIAARGLPAEIADLGPRYRASAERLFGAVTAAESLAEHPIRTRPTADVWSPIEYLAHMRDIAVFYRDRIELVLTTDRPVMTVESTFAEIAVERRYLGEDRATVLDLLDRSSVEVSERLAGITGAQWLRVGVGSSGAERTVLDLARRLAHESHHHLLDLDRVAGSARR